MPFGITIIYRRATYLTLESLKENNQRLFSLNDEIVKNTLILRFKRGVLPY
nr:MAG TPA: hypothetical protein [Caudoviricetes sp.]